MKLASCSLIFFVECHTIKILRSQSIYEAVLNIKWLFDMTFIAWSKCDNPVKYAFLSVSLLEMRICPVCHEDAGAMESKYFLRDISPRYLTSHSFDDR